MIALVFAVASVSKVSVLPPKLERRDLGTAGAVTHVLVDLDRSGIADRSAEWAYFDQVQTRADLVAHLMASEPVLGYVARHAGIPPDQIAATAPFGMDVAGALREPGSEARARELALAKKPYRLEIQSSAGSPIIDVYAQAPSLAEAERVATAAVEGARDYFAAVAAGTKLDPARRAADPDNPMALLQLGQPRGAVLDRGAARKVTVLAFLVGFAIAYAALRGLVAVSIRRRRADVARRADRETGGAAVPTAPRPMVSAARRPEARTSPVLALRRDRSVMRGRARPAAARSSVAVGNDCWPRTTRVLPWMLAAFMTMLWLVPFDSIQLKVSSPIDLTLDRLLLPFIVGTWALAWLIGGRGAPRLRPTWIHGAVAGFVVVAFLSVIFDATDLTRSLELDTSVKKLPILVSYVVVFAMVSSVIRREEVASFLKFTLVLAVLCALGMIWEDRLSHNLFFEWSDKLLPGVFDVGIGNSGWDTMGRRFVHGPTAHPLVAAGMLSMALPIAVLGVMHARGVRAQRILYGLAGVVLMVAVFSTQRKTGLVAPAAGILTLAYFRRRELLRVAPVAVLLVIALVIVAPGTAAPVIDQFQPDNLSGADTVNDRASDYDAIRPDVWTHIALGRGYGSYEPLAHRVIDSQVLGTLLEMGVIGLVAFLVLGGSVVACARRTIHSRIQPWATSALAGAAAAVVFLVLALLFDSLAFPQLPYVFMWFAALVAVLVAPPGETGPPRDVVHAQIQEDGDTRKTVRREVSPPYVASRG